MSLAAGLHTLPATLKCPSGITIAGTGIDCELFLDPAKAQCEAAIVNAEPDMHDVVLRDFVIEGATTPQASRDPNTDVQKAAHRCTVRFAPALCFIAESKATSAQPAFRTHHRSQLHFSGG